MNKTETVIIIILLCTGLVILLAGIGEALREAETRECQRWKMEAEIYGEFYEEYWSDWQEDQCNHHGIKVLD